MYNSQNILKIINIKSENIKINRKYFEKCIDKIYIVRYYNINKTKEEKTSKNRRKGPMKQLARIGRIQQKERLYSETSRNSLRELFDLLRKIKQLLKICAKMSISK